MSLLSLSRRWGGEKEPSFKCRRPECGKKGEWERRDDGGETVNLSEPSGSGLWGGTEGNNFIPIEADQVGEGWEKKKPDSCGEIECKEGGRWGVPCPGDADGKGTSNWSFS